MSFGQSSEEHPRCILPHRLPRGNFSMNVEPPMSEPFSSNARQSEHERGKKRYRQNKHSLKKGEVPLTLKENHNDVMPPKMWTSAYEKVQCIVSVPHGSEARTRISTSDIEVIIVWLLFLGNFNHAK